MPFEYLEFTRRQMLALTPETAPFLSSLDKVQRAKFKSASQSSVGDIKAQLDVLGALDWNLVSVTELRDSGGEILYTFKKG